MGKYAQTSLPCPKCGSSDSLALYEDHGGYCFSNCGYISQNYLDGKPTKTSHSRRAKSMYNIEEIKDYGSADLSHRGIVADAVKRSACVRQCVQRTVSGTSRPSSIQQGWEAAGSARTR